MPDWSESLGNVGGGDASGGGGGDDADAFGDGVRDIRFQKKKNGSGTDDWYMLLPLFPQAIFFKAPRKLTKANTIGFICCYR